MASTPATTSSASTTASTPATTTTTTAATPAKKPIDFSSILKNKTLEEIINEWSADLENQVRLFTKQAIEVSKWDKEVMDNGDKIFALHNEVQRLQVAQKELDQNLEMINTQQTELHQMLESLEQEVTNLANESDMGPIDIEREKGYQLAEDLNAQLDQMGTTLKEIISKINSAQEKAEDSDNPINQIVKVLNIHLNSMQWVDQNAALLQSKIQEVSKQFSVQKTEQERLFGGNM